MLLRTSVSRSEGRHRNSATPSSPSQVSGLPLVRSRQGSPRPGLEATSKNSGTASFAFFTTRAARAKGVLHMSTWPGEKKGASFDAGPLKKPEGGIRAV